MTTASKTAKPATAKPATAKPATTKPANTKPANTKPRAKATAEATVEGTAKATAKPAGEPAAARTRTLPAAAAGTHRRVVRDAPRAAAKPLLAAVGVADLALEQVKDVQEAYVAEARKVQSRLAEVPQQVRTLPSQVRAIPAQVRTLRSEVENRVETVTDRATDLYSSLTVRGEQLVTQIRRQPSTQAAVAEGKEALRAAEAAAAAAQKSFSAGEQAVSDAAATIG